jgi:organic hydroperoxide reductase OsmC/OhrA
MSVHPFPHHYHVGMRCSAGGAVELHAQGLPDMATLPPTEFGGPGDHWSPETLLVGALASCFALSFRAIAARRQIAFDSLDCAVQGVLDREGGNSHFTGFTLRARLVLAAGGDREAADKALLHAKQGCLVSNSLRGSVQLEVVIDSAD